MSALAEPSLIRALASSLIVLSMSALAAQSNPSFDCGKARRADEQTICKDSRLAELDQAVTIAFRQATKGFKKEARDAAKEALKARRSCGTERLCILDQQVKAIEEYADLGSKVPVPPWVGTYRVDLFSARSEPHSFSRGSSPDQKSASSKSIGSAPGEKTGKRISTPLKQGMPYVEARKVLIDAGWQAPMLPASGYDEKSTKVIEECSGDVAMCNAFPEIRNCSGQGYCLMEFTNKVGDKLEITTYGDLSVSNPDTTVTGWQQQPRR